MSGVARASLIVSVFFGLDKILGFLRQVLVARQFGLTYVIDVFNAANNIPDLLSALISGGALGVALIPVLSEFIQLRGRPAAWDLFSRILNLAFLVTAAISLVIIVFARPLVEHVIAPGFPEEQKALTVELMQLDLIAILIFSVSGLIMAGLQANQHFLLPALAPGLYNIGQIFGVGVLAPERGIVIGPLALPAFNLGVHGLVYGVILGATMHLLIQVPGLIYYRFRWAPVIDLHNPGVRQVLTLLGPRILTMFFLQVFFVARDNLASHLGEGAVTALNYGWFIMQVPETLIGTALSIALLPTISEYFALRDEGRYREMVNRAIRVLLALTIPVAVLLAIGIRPLVVVVFAFDPGGTDLVVMATRAYLLGLVGHSLLEVAARSFYARQDARTPLFAAALNALVYVSLAVWLSGLFGPVGIALANSIAFTSEALLLLFLLNRRAPGILQAGPTLVRTGLAALVIGGGVYLLMQLPAPALPLTVIALIVGGVLTIPFIWREIKILVRL